MARPVCGSFRPIYRASGLHFFRQEMMSGNAKTQFSPRWREELVCTLDGKSFVIEFSMGSAYHAYLPSRERWEGQAPEWAKEIWPQVMEDLKQWCESQKILLTVDVSAWVTFDA
jgi:hypothetical protein